MGHPTRAVARSTRGIVASPHASASAVGVEVLRRGGNAVDAAVATNAVLAVVYPASCGIGGDAMWMVYEPRDGAVACYNGSGAASAALEAKILKARGIDRMPQRGALSVTVPGAVRSWETVLAAHGRTSLDALLVPAERYARDGFAVTDVVAASFARAEALLLADPEATALFLRRGLPAAGDVLRNAPLADVLCAIRERGASALYDGPIADAIAGTVARGGNPMTSADLASARTERTDPLRVAWRGLDVLAMPPNSQGSLALMVLGALADDRPNGSDWHHLAVEAFKRAYGVRDRWFGEPAAMPRPAGEHLTQSALGALRAEIGERAAPFGGTTVRGGTVAIACVDEDGCAVSLIQSLYMGFGAGIVAEGTGIVLHNRGAYFSLQAGSPNELRGGHRPLHTLSPGMALRRDVPELVYGTMGGDGQVQTHVQLLRNVYDLGMDVQTALDAPRFVYGRDGASEFAGTVREMTVFLRAQSELRPRVERCEREIEELKRAAGR